MSEIELRDDLRLIMSQFRILNQKYSNLKKQMSEIQAEHRKEIIDINQVHSEQVQRLEDMNEILRTENDLQVETHRETINRLKIQQLNEITTYQRDIHTLNNKIQLLTTQIEKNSHFLHPALHEAVKITPKKRAPTSQFDWPPLEIEKQGSMPKIQSPKIIEKKKKKLFWPETDF